MIRLARRLWWATLPFYGWTGYTDVDGAVPPPLWAHPLSWLHRLVAFAVFRRRDVFGPVYHESVRRLDRPRDLRPWQ